MNKNLTPLKNETIYNNVLMKIVEEQKAESFAQNEQSSPRSELSGITENNISENDNDVPDEIQQQRKK